MVLDRNLITYVFAPSKTTYGVSEIYLLTDPPTLFPSYHLLHSAHPDHYAIFLASPTDPPGDIVFGEVQVPGGLRGSNGEKAIVLHQPEEIISIGDKRCRLGFKFDWTFEWEGKTFKWSRDCIAGIMKAMTLSYIPAKQFKDDPPITLALFSPSPSITLLDYNFPRIQISDIKGFEVIILLFASLFVDILKSHGEGHGIPIADIKKETQRLQKLEDKEEEVARRKKAVEIDRETERLRKLTRDEFLEKRRRDEEITKETERLRMQEGYYINEKPTGIQGKKKHWWTTAGEQWSQSSAYGPKYSVTGARMMGYSN